MPKTHGCSGPPHLFQICSYLIVISLTTAFYLLIVTMLPSPLPPLAIVLYTPCLLGLVVFGLLTSLTDPTDPVVTAERRAKAKQLPFDTKPYSQICTICRAHVLVLSKHCGQCDRCVDGFDHHCKWLNNCIGRRNYRFFAVLIAFLESMAAVQIAFSAVITSLMFSQDFAGNVEELLGTKRYLYVSLVLMQFGMVIVLFGIVGQLIILHVWLRTHGLTTYDFIMKRRQAKRSQVASIQKEEEEPAQDQDATTLHENSVSPDNEGSSAAGSKTRLVLDKYMQYKRMLRNSRDQSSAEGGDEAEEEAEQLPKVYYPRKYRKRQIVPEETPPESSEDQVPPDPQI